MTCRKGLLAARVRHTGTAEVNPQEKQSMAMAHGGHPQGRRALCPSAGDYREHSAGTRKVGGFIPGSTQGSGKE